MNFQVMSHHPQYLDIFQKAQAFILRGDGPLPFHYRHFIAIMVISPLNINNPPKIPIQFRPLFPKILQNPEILNFGAFLSLLGFGNRRLFHRSSGCRTRFGLRILKINKNCEKSWNSGILAPFYRCLGSATDVFSTDPLVAEPDYANHPHNPVCEC